MFSRHFTVFLKRGRRYQITVFGDLEYCILWQYWLWSFQAGDTQLERFLHKNQHPQRKLLNFEFRINGKLLKIGHHFSNKKNVNNKKCAPKLVFFNEKKDSDDF